MYLLILIDVYYMHNNKNYHSKMCWNKQGPDFAVGSIQLSFRAIVFVHQIHAKVFSIQMLLHFSQNCAERLNLSDFHFITVVNIAREYVKPYRERYWSLGV